MEKKIFTSSKFRRLMSFLLVFATVISISAGSCTNAYAQYYDGSELNVSDNTQKYLADLKNELFKLESNPVQEGIDVTSDELQSIIVEFKADPIAVQEVMKGRNYSLLGDDVSKQHEIFNEFVSNMQKTRDKGIVIDRSYDYVYNGVAMEIKGTDIPMLLESGVVKSIWPNIEFDLIDEEISTDLSDYDGVSSRMVDSTGIIGSAELNAMGITGEGIKVGILDTGMDYTHPDLKDSYKGGWDFVDNDNDPMETTYKQLLALGFAKEDAAKYATYHGTHVAGTIAGTGKNDQGRIKITGVAPEADLYAYRVLGMGGTGNTDDIIAGIERAVKDGMDVLNLSLGTPVNNAFYPTSIAINNATMAGVVCAIANGNDGPKMATMGAPASAPLALAVGSTTNGIKAPIYSITMTGGTQFLAETILTTYEDFDFSETTEIVYCGEGYETDFIGNDPETGEPYSKVKGKIVLLDRGELSFHAKAFNARSAEAVAVILVNNKKDEEKFGVYVGEFAGKDIVPVFGISLADGKILKEQLGISSEILSITETVENPVDDVISFSTTGGAITGSAITGAAIKPTGDVSTTKADALSEFSSRGPSSDMTIKPDVCAPGEGILSTFPIFVNNKENDDDYSMAYSRISGTSMATPHVAGVAALMLQENGNLTPEDVKTILMNTCVPLDHDYGINEMGAGRIDAIKAIESIRSMTQIRVLDKARTLDENKEAREIDYISGSLSFDLITKSEEEKSVEKTLQLQNGTDSAKTFSTSMRFLNNEDLTVNEETGQDATVQDALRNGVSIAMPSKITAEAMSDSDFTIAINIPGGSDTGRYEGIITFTNDADGNETYTMPFSVMYTVPGFGNVELSRAVASNDLEWMHFMKMEKVGANISINSMFDECYVYISDYETNEIFGYVGYADLFGAAPGGGEVTIDVFDSRLSYFPTAGIDTPLIPVRHRLSEGKYIVSFIGKDNEGREYREDRKLLVDNTPPEVELTIPTGLVEIKPEDFVYDEEYGKNIYWLEGNVTDNSLEELRAMGYDININDIVEMPLFINSMPGDSVPVDENGKFAIGIEEADLYQENFMTGQRYYKLKELAPHPVDAATALNLFKIPRYYLMMEGTTYMQVSTNASSVIREKDNLKATVSAHNLKDISVLEFSFKYSDAFGVNNVQLTEQFNNFIKENNYTAKTDFMMTGDLIRFLDFTVEIFDKDGNRVEIEAGELPIFEISMQYEDDNSSKWYREYLELENIRAYKAYDDSENELAKYDAENLNMSENAVDAYLDVVQNKSTALVLEQAQGFYDPMVGAVDLDLKEINELGINQYTWAEAPDGKKYYSEYDEEFGNNSNVIRNLPISEEIYTIHVNVPGHFEKSATFTPSRNINGNVGAIEYSMLGSEFYTAVYAGDANSDGVIDISDAELVAEHWGEEIDFRTSQDEVDFTFDGIVDKLDMSYVVSNFGAINEQKDDYFDHPPTPKKETADGKNLNDILEEIGYISETSVPDFVLIVDGTTFPELQMHIGDTHSCVVTTDPANIDLDIMWESKNSKIAAVDDDGVITAVNPGSTTIVVTDKNTNSRASVNVAVFNNEDGDLGATVVSTEESISTYVGANVKLEYNVTPSNYEFSSIAFMTSNDKAVVRDGILYAQKPGKCYVTATFDENAHAKWVVNIVAVDDEDPVTPPTPPSTGGGTTAPSDNVEVGDAEVVVTVDTEAVVSGDKATVATDDKAINEAIEEVLKNLTDTNLSASVKINVVDIKDAKEISINLSNSIITTLGEKNVGLVIESSIAKMQLDIETLKAIAAGGDGDVNISIDRVNAESRTDKNVLRKVNNAEIYNFNIYSGDEKITDFSGGNVILTIPYITQDSKHSIVWYVDDEGSLTEIENAQYDEESKNMIFSVGHFSIYAIGTFPFEDVKSGDWYYDSVVFAYNTKLMDGTGYEAFAPNEETTRAMIVTLLHRLEGKPIVQTKSAFEDVEENVWYTEAINWAVENNIVKGYTDAEFGVQDAATREQIAVILYNYAKYKGYDLTAITTASYNDSKNVSSWAEEALGWAINQKLIQGYNNNLSPKDSATRAQIAAIFERLMAR